MKYDWKFKLDCVLKYKEGKRDFVPIGIKRDSFLPHVVAWVKTFDDLYKAVDKYINYYNNERIKSKTKWMPPSKFREASMLSL